VRADTLPIPLHSAEHITGDRHQPAVTLGYVNSRADNHRKKQGGNAHEVKRLRAMRRSVFSTVIATRILLVPSF
jgi:hypothetical protein